MTHTIEIDEGQRQMMLLAFAHLAIERPGWDQALCEIALWADDRTEAGRPAQYDAFKALYSGQVTGSVAPPARSAVCPTCGTDDPNAEPLILGAPPCADPWHDAGWFDSVEAVCASYMAAALLSAFPWLAGGEPPEPAAVAGELRQVFMLLDPTPEPAGIELVDGPTARHFVDQIRGGTHGS